MPLRRVFGGLWLLATSEQKPACDLQTGWKVFCLTSLWNNPDFNLSFQSLQDVSDIWQSVFSRIKAKKKLFFLPGLSRVVVSPQPPGPWSQSVVSSDSNRSVHKLTAPFNGSLLLYSWISSLTLVLKTELLWHWQNTAAATVMQLLQFVWEQRKKRNGGLNNLKCIICLLPDNRQAPSVALKGGYKVTLPVVRLNWWQLLD